MKVLVIVDMQNDFIDGVLGTPEAKTARDNLMEKLKQENENTAIIFTRDTHRDGNYLNILEGEKLPVKHCIINTNGWCIDDEIFHLGSNREFEVINKNSFGSLDALELEVCGFFDGENDEIEICGLCTDICVVSNALILRAAFPNTPITLDSKCCAGTTPQAHEAALTVMRSCQIDVI